MNIENMTERRLQGRDKVIERNSWNNMIEQVLYGFNSLLCNNIFMCPTSIADYNILLDDGTLILIVFVSSVSGNIAT